METIVYSENLLDGSVDLSPYPTIQSNRKYTVSMLKSLNNGLNAKYNNNDKFCIAIAGSFGRLEASKLSDADIFIVYDERMEKYELERTRLDMLEQVRNLGINASNPRGVFTEPSFLGQLIANIGALYDPVPHLSQRMLLLMESKALYNYEFFRSAIKKLINKYCEHVINDPKKEFVFLLNEVIKYFRTICVNYQFTFWRANENWPIRNIKLKNSRILMYGGLLMLILNASKYAKDKFDYLTAHIELTPIEKISHVYIDNKEDPSQFLQLYEAFLSNMSKKEVRDNLLGLGYEERYKSPYYKELKSDSDKLCTELSRFVLSKQGVWTDAVFEYLLF